MRYVIGLLLGIGLIILTFVLIIRAFTGNDDAPQPRQVTLVDYASSDAVVRYTIDGRINADQEHSRVRVTVGRDRILFEQVAGYEGRLVNSRTYESNQQAYATFLRALDRAGYTRSNPDPETDDDERGYCANGRRFVYEILDGAEQVQRLWSTSCNSTTGSYQGGGASAIRTLFQQQVPDWGELTRGIRNL